MSGTTPANRPAPNPSSSGGASAEDEAYLRKSQGRKTTTWVIAVVAIVIVVALIGGAYAAGWIGKTPKTTTSAGTYQPPCASIGGAGSTFVNPEMSYWAGQYHGLACTATGGSTTLNVNYQAVGSGQGITDLTDKLVNFGASDAPLTPTQVHGLPAAAVTMPDSAGAVAVIYNLGVKNAVTGAAQALNLTGPVLADIWLGHITNWNVTNITSLNPGAKIPTQAIIPIVRSDGSGTTYAYTSYLCAESTYFKNTVGAGTTVHWPGTPTGAKGSSAVAGDVNTLVGSIGYDELNYALYAGSSTSFAAVQNPAGHYILPNVTNTAAALAGVTSYPAPTGNWSGFAIINEAGAGTYPIATLTYLMVYTDVGKVYGSSFTQAQAQALVSFLWWITHTGQNYSSSLYYVPLPSSITAGVDELAISEILYNGATLQSH